MLAGLGHEIFVIKTNAEINKELNTVYDFKKLNVQVENISIPTNVSQLIKAIVVNPVSFLKAFSFDFKQFKKEFAASLSKIVLNKIDPDIVHFEFSGIGVKFLPLLKNLKAKKIVSCRGTSEKVKLLTDVQRQKDIKILFENVDAIHCVSSDMQRTIVPYCSNNQKVFVNRPAIDAEFFLPPANKTDNSVTQILSIGRFTFQKGYLIGLLAIKELVNKNIEIEWKIAGDGPQKEELLFHIHELGLKNHVQLLGNKNKNEINTLLDTSDIFMLTSFYEGIPNVILEAMSKELPVVTTRCGGVEEVIDNGTDGFIAELYDHHQVADYMSQLISNKALQINMGKAARMKIVKHFTLQHQATIFEEHYKNLLSK